MLITGVLGRGWGSPTDWSGIDPRNNRKDRPDQAEDASCPGSTKELRRSKMKADGGVSQSWEVALKPGNLPKRKSLSISSICGRPLKSRERRSKPIEVKTGIPLVKFAGTPGES
ncbi:hypothetical protein Tco_1082721 [Tanacetum coccineum]|uniref:Uncharacterized protein n=1 Tax=Tanacetum coccineum TaxID=301880 RepID=A0ABQ5I178_9ASTR